MSVEIQHLYLVCAQLDAEGIVKKSSARPVGNTFLTLEDQNTIVFDKGNDPSEYNKQTVEKGRQLYLTDVVGSIGNFINGKHVDGVKQGIKEAFEQRSNIEIEEKTKVFFPPAHLINYSFAANGYKNWLPKLHEQINTIISASNEGKALIELKAFQLDVDVDFEKPDSSSTVDYKNWHAKNAGGKIKALCLPRTRAFMVRFSDERYVGAKINITNRQGAAVFYADAEKIVREAEVIGVQDLDGTTLGYGAVFYDLDNHFDTGGDAENQMFQFSIKPNARNMEIDDQDNIYSLVERLRFPIKTLAGDFDVINGDAFSLEECLVRQFPQRYPNIIKNIADQQNKPDAIKGSESLLHAFNTNQDKIKLIGGAYAADSTASFLRTVGMGFYNGIEEKNEGLKLLRGSINLAFNIYDLAGEVNAAKKFILDNYVDGVSDSVQTITRVRALEHLTGDVAPAELWSDSVAANVDGIADNMNEVALPNRLKKVFKTSQSIVGGLSKGLEFYSVFNDAHGIYVAYDKMDNAVSSMHTLMDDYAYKVRFKDAVDDTSVKPTRSEIERSKQDLQRFQNKHKKTTQVTQVGDLKFINVTFAFDRAGFAKDESFSELIDFLKSLKIPFDLILSGHTCSIGTTSYNLALSERRAQSVEKILLDAGLDEISDLNITIRAFGESKPVVSNSTEENRKKNRRVDAVIILKKIGRFKPSREGIESVEKYRALSSIHTAEMGDSISKSVVSTLDLIAGLPPTNLAHLGFSLLWTVGGVLCDGANLLNDAVFGEAYLKTVDDFNQYDRLSAANQALLLERTEWNKNISAGYFLETQARLKAEALNGLMQLLIRCSLETDDVVKRLKFDIDNVSDDRTSYTYDDNLEYYQVKGYVEKFILSDGWKLFTGVLHPVALDDYWLYLIKTNKLEEKLRRDEDLSWQDKAIEVANEYAKEAGSYADLVKDNIIDAAGDLVLSGRYIVNNAISSFHLEREYLTTACFKEFFPVHYTQSDNLEELFIAAKPDFSDLDSDIYLGMMHSVKEAGVSSNTWTSMSRWFEDKRNWISPLDEIRICILLDPNSGVVGEYIDNGAISYIPYKVIPTRVDGLNMSGPANDGFIQKLKYEDLTTDELKLLGDHDKEDVEDSLYGAIVYPYFKLGKKIIQGTKPVANAVSAWLNVTSEHSLSSVFNWDQRWDMVYKYEVVLGYNTETLRNVCFDKKITSGRMKGTYQRYEFPYAIWDGEHVDSPYKGESMLLDRHFLQVGVEEKESLPPLFVEPEVFCMLDVNCAGSGRYDYPNENWYQKSKLPNDVKVDSSSEPSLSLPKFNWEKPVEVIVLIVSDAIDESAYSKRLLKTDSIPAQIQLLRDGINDSEELDGASISDDEIGGPKYDVALRPIGSLIKNRTSGVEFEWSDVADNEDFSKLEKHLAEPLALQMLSGFRAKLEEDDEEREKSGNLGSDLMNAVVDQVSEKVEDTVDSIADKWDEIAGNAERKPVYAARVLLNYQSILGHIESGLKPFAVNPFDEFNEELTADSNEVWKLKVKVTSAGDSGLKEHVAKGEYALPYPMGLGDKSSHWYSIKEERLQKVKKIIAQDKAQAEEFKNKTVFERPPSHPITPLMKWVLDDEDRNDISDKQKEGINQWLLKQGERKLLSMADHKSIN